MKHCRVLITNRAIPSTTIGSWTTRINKFIENHPFFFNKILAPSSLLQNSVYCKKRRFISWKPYLLKLQLKNWVARDYIQAIKRLSKSCDKLQVVVMDDLMLLRAISYSRYSLSCQMELVFSFHGFYLDIDETLLSDIDRILWLSKSGLEASKKGHNYFPESKVVGNAVDSDIFFPLDDNTFEQNRLKYGYSPSDEVLIWVANDRPKKGFQIFKCVVEELLKRQPHIKVIVIGSHQTIDNANVKNLGRIPNKDVASYLQISNYYMFTTLYEEGFGLSVVEAYKCGNAVISSNYGAIPEVLFALPNTYLIENSANANSWLEAFEQVQKDTDYGRVRLSYKETDPVWEYGNWEQRFLDALN